MTPSTTATPRLGKETTTVDRVTDAYRQATHVAQEATAHVAQEASRLTSLAADAMDDGLHAAKQAMASVRKSVDELGDLKDATAERVKAQPLKAVGLAAGVGLALGLAIGLCRRPKRHQ